MSRKLIRGVGIFALFGAVLFCLMTVLDYLWGINSDAMDYARQVVRQSDALTQQVGAVERVDLGKFWGFRQESGFSGARAELSLRATGSRGSIQLVLHLEERGDGWHVVSSSVPL